MSGFAQALPVTLRFEGGYSDHPDDPGGATMKGITQNTYDAWRASRRLSPRPVKEISDDEVEAIYHRDYWVAGKCDALPWPVSLAHFDACVNHGVRNAAKLLQRALGVEDDGVIGPQTLGAVEDADPEELVNAMLWKRLEFYEAITLNKKSLRTFLLGWLSRVNHLRRRTLAA